MKTPTFLLSIQLLAWAFAALGTQPTLAQPDNNKLDLESTGNFRESLAKVQEKGFTKELRQLPAEHLAHPTHAEMLAAAKAGTPGVIVYATPARSRRRNCSPIALNMERSPE